MDINTRRLWRKINRARRVQRGESVKSGVIRKKIEALVGRVQELETRVDNNETQLIDHENRIAALEPEEP